MRNREGETTLKKKLGWEGFLPESFDGAISAISRRAWCLLMLFLLLTATSGMADSFGLSPQDIEELTRSLFSRHEAAHSEIKMLDINSIGTSGTIQCKYPAGAPETIIGCVDFGFSTKRILPKDGVEMNVLFREMLRNAKNTAEIYGDAGIVDLARVNQLMKLGSLISFFPEKELWLEGTVASAELIISPFYLQDIQGNLLDDAMYFMLLLTAEASSEIWICADQALVYDFFTKLDFSKGSESFAAPVLRWMEKNGGVPAISEAVPEPEPAESAPDEPTVTQEEAPTPEQTPETAQQEAPLAQAPETAQPSGTPGGTLTVISDGNVNLRAEDHFKAAIVGKAKPGDEYDSYGSTQSGWYEIRIAGDKVAFIPPEAVSFSE